MQRIFNRRKQGSGANREDRMHLYGGKRRIAAEGTQEDRNQGEKEIGKGKESDKKGGRYGIPHTYPPLEPVHPYGARFYRVILHF